MQQSSHKLYIIVDKTLSSSQRAVQACHAAVEFAKAYPEWEHQSLVLLGAKDEDDLEDWYTFLAHQPNVKTHHFRESYWDGRLTAIAAYGCDHEVRNLPLL